MSLILEVLDKGGWISTWIAIGYIIGLMITIERLIYFGLTRGSFRRFLKALDTEKQDPADKTIMEKPALKRFKRTPFYAVSQVFFQTQAYAEKLSEQLVWDEARRVIRNMEFSLWLLPLIVHLAPLLGLLGTMTGLIRAFKGIEAMGGRVDVAVLAGGIWEAMATTVAGLVVAILTQLVYRMLDQYVSKRAQDLEALIAKMNQMFRMAPS